MSVEKNLEDLRKVQWLDNSIILGKVAFDMGYRVCEECQTVIDKDVTAFVDGPEDDPLTPVYHNHHAPLEEVDDREVAHAISCGREPRHSWKDCPDEPDEEEVWKVTLLVTSSDSEWTDRDLPQRIGPLEIFGFADNGSGKGFATPLTIAEAEKLML